MKARKVLLPLLAAVAVAVAGCSSAPAKHTTGPSSSAALDANPGIDPGSPLGGKPAPDFTLTDQYGHRVSLSQFRGKAVLLAFVDSHCTTVCPLTTTSMLQAVSLLGTAGQAVQLVGIDANPDATKVSDVRDYSVAHGMMHSWEFLTGSLTQLKRVWKEYDVFVEAVRGDIDHEPAIYLIRPDGREQTIYLTQMTYTATDQQAQVLANATAAVLPGHPHARQSVNLRYIPGVKPTTGIELPVAGGQPAGSTVTLGRGHPHLVMFFATWVDENINLTADMKALNAYQREATARGWPPVVAVDEASTETSPSDLPTFLKQLHGALDYPVVVDRYGALADGYGVQDQPWFALVSASGRILAHHDGWYASTASLDQAVASAVKPGS